MCFIAELLGAGAATAGVSSSAASTLATAFSIASTIGSAVASIVGQAQQAQAEATYQARLVEANQRQMQANRDMATRAYLEQVAGAHAQLAQQREAAAASNAERALRAAEARGEVLANAAQAGVHGLSLNALLSDFYRQEDMFRVRNEQNLLFKQQATAAQVKSYFGEARGRIESVQPYIPSPRRQIDYFGPAFSVVRGLSDTYLQHDRDRRFLTMLRGQNAT